MKNKKILIILAIVLSVVAVVVLTSAISTFTGKPSDDRTASYYDNSPNKVLERTIEYNGEKMVLTYQKTVNRLPTVNKKVTSKYNAIDMYTNYKGEEFGFYYNSDELCWFFYSGKAVSGEKITGEEALAKARAVVAPYIDVEKYDVELFGFDDVNYTIKLTKKIYDILTDDSVSFAISSEGQIEAWTVANAGRYDDAGITEKQIESCREGLLRKIKFLTGVDEVSIFQERIVSNERGKIQLCIQTSEGTKYYGNIK